MQHFMIFGHFDYVMSTGTPPMLLLDGEEEDRAPAEASSLAYGARHLPPRATTFNNSDESSMHMESNNPKRTIPNSQDSNINNKQMKITHQRSGSEIPGWGPNGHAMNVPESGLFLGSLLPNEFTSNSGLRSTASSNTHVPGNANLFRGNEFTLHHAGLSVMRDQMHRNEAVNALILANLYSPNGQRHGNHSDFSFLDAVQSRQQSDVALQHQLRNQLPSLAPLNQMNHVLYGNNSIHGANSSYPSIMSGQDHGMTSSEQLQSLLRQLQTSNNLQQNNQNLSSMVAENSSQIVNAPSVEVPLYQQNLSQRQSIFSNGPPNLDLALCVEGKIHPYTERPVFSLGISEDPNWLSEFHCFVRSDLVEVFRASHDDVTSRNNSISYQQVGIRCRFCAHLPPSSRSGRSSAFPSSLRQIYQSFTMMLRDHFSNCEAIPSAVLTEFNNLKDKPAQGATDSKRYWIYSAKKVGMIDTNDGIMMTQESRYEGSNMKSFGTVVGQNWEDDTLRNDSLVRPSDRGHVSEFLFVVMSQVQPIRLTETECIGNRRSLQVGLPGFGCRYCCAQKRLGLCRMFPARRRTLPQKVNDLYDHLRRCTLCPQAVKDSLEQSKRQMTVSFRADQGSNREFYDRVWSRLGHSGVSAGT
jgi:hypothetical protein